VHFASTNYHYSSSSSILCTHQLELKDKQKVFQACNPAMVLRKENHMVHLHILSPVRDSMFNLSRNLVTKHKSQHNQYKYYKLISTVFYLNENIKCCKQKSICINRLLLPPILFKKCIRIQKSPYRYTMTTIYHHWLQINSYQNMCNVNLSARLLSTKCAYSLNNS
jgi:hypothetical protein